MPPNAYQMCTWPGIKLHHFRVVLLLGLGIYGADTGLYFEKISDFRYFYEDGLSKLGICEIPTTDKQLLVRNATSNCNNCFPSPNKFESFKLLVQFNVRYKAPCKRLVNDG